MKKHILNYIRQNRVTPDTFDNMGDEDIYVFFSNIIADHRHNHIAMSRGAILRQSERLQGLCYAIHL